jgi:uncharacterized heparinase superfamily protein
LIPCVIRITEASILWRQLPLLKRVRNRRTAFPMKLASLRHPLQTVHLLNHRVLRPRFWDARTAPQLRTLTDEEFLKITGWGSDRAQAVAQFHERARFRFFFHPRNRKDFFLHTLTSLQPEEQLLADADATRENRFQTLGSPLTPLGSPMPWHRDFKSGKEWPLRALTIPEILDLRNSSDIKVPWEISRFHQVWWLGKAYWLTGREEYAEKFRSLVDEWIEANPPALGANWVVAMEAAIRATNLIAGYYFFCESRSCDDAFWLRLFKSLYVHGSFIKHHLEYSRNNGNHFLSDVVGMIAIGTFFADTPFGAKWLTWARGAVEREMQRQVEPDGVDYEKSSSYHRLVLELFSMAAMLSMVNKRPLSEGYMKRLEQMHEFVLHYTRPDGSAPLWGDADDGRLFRFRMDEDVNDHRHALSTGAVLFSRPDFARASGHFHEETLWYFGGEGFERFRALHTETKLESKSFPGGGVYIMRNEHAHIFIDAGELGQRGRGGHGHNDTLSFTYWHDGHDVLVDSGTYSYTFDTITRNELRSVRAHNAVCVDGNEIAEFDDLWSVKEDRTKPRVIEWKPEGDIQILEAEHGGYTRLASPVLHNRRIEFATTTGAITIKDSLQGTGEHEIEAFLHFAPGATVTVLNHDHAEVMIAQSRYQITASKGTFEIRKTWYSRSYGIRERKPTLVLKMTEQLPVGIECRIEPLHP